MRMNSPTTLSAVRGIILEKTREVDHDEEEVDPVR